MLPNCIAARLRTGPAHVGTNPAMLMALRMPHALFAAAATRFDADRKHHSANGVIRPRATRAKNAGRAADICAVQIHADTLAQFVNPLLGKTGVGTGGARLVAIEASLGRPHRKLIGIAVNPGVGF
jgi:hypothetical protein